MTDAPTWLVLIFSFGGLIGGGCLTWWAAARRFERRNPIGIEQFSSYAQMMSSRTSEGFAKFLGNALVLLGLAGLLLVAVRLAFQG